MVTNPGFEDTTGAVFNELYEFSDAHSFNRTGDIPGWAEDPLGNTVPPGTGVYLIDGTDFNNAFAGDYFGYAIGSGGNPDCIVLLGPETAGLETGLFAVNPNQSLTFSFEAAPFRPGGNQGDSEDLSFISVEAVYYNALGDQEATVVMGGGRLNAESNAWDDLAWDNYEYNFSTPNDPNVAFARYFVSVNSDIAGTAFDNFALVPEPSAAIFAGLAALALCVRRRS